MSNIRARRRLDGEDLWKHVQLHGECRARVEEIQLEMLGINTLLIFFFKMLCIRCKIGALQRHHEIVSEFTTLDSKTLKAIQTIGCYYNTYVHIENRKTPQFVRSEIVTLE